MRRACSTIRLAVALPLAFLVAALAGVAIERSIIRFLYGRPLETLLATFGLSLILQQAVRTIFGPTNREVGNPAWMSGAFDLGGLTLTWNRLWIIVFALLVFAALMLVLRYTALGPADAGGDAEPAHGGGDGHPHRPGRRADLRPRLRRRRHRRAWRSARSTMSAPISARATSSTASWSWCSAASAICGARWSGR